MKAGAALVEITARDAGRAPVALALPDLNGFAELLTDDEALQLARILWRRIRSKVPRLLRWLGDRVLGGDS